MLNPPPDEFLHASGEPANSNQVVSEASRFLILEDPEAVIEVELIDRPVDLPRQQFEALLFESECEV